MRRLQSLSWSRNSAHQFIVPLFRAVNIQIAVTPHSDAEYKRFGGPCCVHLQDEMKMRQQGPPKSCYPTARRHTPDLDLRVRNILQLDRILSHTNTLHTLKFYFLNLLFECYTPIYANVSQVFSNLQFFLTKILLKFLISSMRATRPINLIFLNLGTPIIFGKDHEL